MMLCGAHVTFCCITLLSGASPLLSSWSRYLRGTSDWPSPSFCTRLQGMASLCVSCLQVRCPPDPIGVTSRDWQPAFLHDSSDHYLSLH